MTEQFDVFLAHNSVDKPLVRDISARLRERGLNPWLDEEQIPPGGLFQEEIQKAIPNIKSAAIIIGTEGLGQWQEIELHTLTSQFIEKRIKVIPVLLPGVTVLPEKFLFLRQFNWVSFKDIKDDDAFYRFEWGITGKKPQLTNSSQSPHASQSPSLSVPQSSQILAPTLPRNIILEMVKIPAGTFMMGSDESDDEKPKHQVNLQEFYLGKYCVTQEQYQAVMENNPFYFRDDPKNPAKNVSWDEAQIFCQKLSEKTRRKYRLPTEAEWEYACRAGTQTRYYFGDNKEQLGEYAWYQENADSKTHAVGQKKPNNWGLYDMYGNVWEWCEDGWHNNYENAPTDGTAWNDNHSQSKSRVLRGGSWSYDPRYCRSASRSCSDNRIADIGFRVVSPQDS